MADHDDEELRMALQMSLQPPPEAKRSKPRENAGTGASMEVSEANARRLQRELRASAAEERMLSAQTPRVQTVSSNVHMQQGSGMAEVKERPLTAEKSSPQQVYRGKRSIDDESQGLSVQQSEQLYSMVFGPQVTKDVLSQWCNQGFRFSSEPGTSTGLVQREGGPCGVLAPIQVSARIEVPKERFLSLIKEGAMIVYKKDIQSSTYVEVPQEENIDQTQVLSQLNIQGSNEGDGNMTDNQEDTYNSEWENETDNDIWNSHEQGNNNSGWGNTDFSHNSEWENEADNDNWISHEQGNSNSGSDNTYFRHNADGWEDSE